MEVAFYTLHLNAVMEALLKGTVPDNVDDLLYKFARTVSYVLRRAHGKKICKHHSVLFKKLGSNDAIISMNYDLVAERALASLHRHISSFGIWLYGGNARQQITPKAAQQVPVIFKLHGSANWIIKDKVFSVRQKSWDEFDESPGYSAHRIFEDEFPILLPFWEKKIEIKPWAQIWHDAGRKLRRCENLVVFGYSLPPTDLKAKSLFQQTITVRSLTSERPRLCVVDKNPVIRQKWQKMAPASPCWQYESIDEFRKAPPPWW